MGNSVITARKANKNSKDKIQIRPEYNRKMRKSGNIAIKKYTDEKITKKLQQKRIKRKIQKYQNISKSK